MKVNISVVRPDIIPEVWSIVYPLLQPAIEGDIFLTESTLKDRLTQDRALMFVATVGGAIRGAVVVQIEDSATRMAHIIALGGIGLKDWKSAMLSALDKYAISKDCKYLFSAGREAWKRILPEFTAGKRLFYKEVQSWEV